MNLMLIHGFSIEKSLYFIAEVVNMVSYLNRGLSVIPPSNMLGYTKHTKGVEPFYHHQSFYSAEDYDFKREAPVKDSSKSKKKTRAKDSGQLILYSCIVFFVFYSGKQSVYFYHYKM